MKENNDREENIDFEPDVEVNDDAELEDIEENSEKKIKILREKLKECEREKMEHLENLQRTKAEFLNGKRRLEEERIRDKERAINAQIEKLLPLCDSFHMATSDKEAWEEIDPTWRKGIESIHNQLQSILSSYNVFEIHPINEHFDPNFHEAMANVPVEDKKLHHTVVTVIQNGFVKKDKDKTELIRPARVAVGEYSE